MEKSLLKFNKLKDHFTGINSDLALENIIHTTQLKKRLLVRKGQENIVLRLKEIVLIFTQNKGVFVIDHSLKKYTSDKTMNELEVLLPGAIFFRANRQYIINVEFIKSFKVFQKVKLQIDLSIPNLNHSIVVSQKNARNFKRWMQEA